jgi:hypothetical protein
MLMQFTVNVTYGTTITDDTINGIVYLCRFKKDSGTLDDEANSRSKRYSMVLIIII